MHKVGFYKSSHKYIFSQNSVSKPPISTNLSKLDRQYSECDLHLQTKMYFSICDYKVGFRKSSHIIIVILFLKKYSHNSSELTYAYNKLEMTRTHCLIPVMCGAVMKNLVPLPKSVPQIDLAAKKMVLFCQFWSPYRMFK